MCGSEETIPNETWEEKKMQNTDKRIKDLEDIMRQYNKPFIGLLEGELQRKRGKKYSDIITEISRIDKSLLDSES